MNRIGLMDCNNFFVSCERLFRPDLLEKPVAVLSSNDGCIVARSQEVKDLGIPMGIPYFKVKDSCKKEHITLFSSNFTLYRDISARVMQVLKREMEHIGVYSIDEAFFEVDDAMDERAIHRLRDVIMKETGIPVSIGVASTKTLAKVANSFAKKGSGVSMLNEVLWRKRQAEVSCGSIWGIGRQTSAKLTKEGIHTVADLLKRGIGYSRNNFGTVGERMYLELSGTPVFTIGEGIGSEHQSIMSTRSFHDAVYELPVLESALGYHVAHVAEKLRKRSQVASHIRIIAAPGRYSDFILRQASADIELASPTADTLVLLQEALRLLRELFDPEIPYKKAGFVVSGIMPTEYVLPSLFTESEEEKGSLIDAVVDRINERFGGGTIRPGVVQKTEKWQANAKLRSKEYTTKWSEIRSVKAI